MASHGGGGICETISRMDYAYELQDEAFFLGPYVPMKIQAQAQSLPEEDVPQTATYTSGEHGASMGLVLMMCFMAAMRLP